MENHPDLIDLLREFIAENVRFLVVGGHAVGIHARPRMTKDLDLFVARDSENAGRVFRALAKFGAPLDDVAEFDFTREDLIYQMGRPPLRVDVITSIDGVDFEEAWLDRMIVPVGDVNAYVIGRDALLKNKRATGRPQDVADVAAILKRTPQTPP